MPAHVRIDTSDPAVAGPLQRLLDRGRSPKVTHGETPSVGQRVRLSDIALQEQWPHSELVDEALADLALFLGYACRHSLFVNDELASLAGQLRAAIYEQLSRRAQGQPWGPAVPSSAPEAASASECHSPVPSETHERDRVGA